MKVKVVLKVDLHDEKAKKKALKTVSSLRGIDSITVQLKEKKMTVVGNVDPVEVVGKLRKLWFAEILTVGPPKDEEKETKDKSQVNYFTHYPYYNRYPTYYYVHTEEGNPNACAIC